MGNRGIARQLSKIQGDYKDERNNLYAHVTVNWKAWYISTSFGRIRTKFFLDSTDLLFLQLKSSGQETEIEDLDPWGANYLRTIAWADMQVKEETHDCQK